MDNNLIASNKRKRAKQKTNRAASRSNTPHSADGSSNTDVSKNIRRRLRKKQKVNNVAKVESTTDNFVPLASSSDERSDSDANNDFQLVSDFSDEEQQEAQDNLGSNGKSVNALTNNQDFIGFDFSSDESEKEHHEFSDDGYISNDEQSMNTKSDKSVTSLYPWIKDHDHSKQREIADWLTLEIKDFVAYISPSKYEILQRNSTVRNLRECITEFWPDVEVHVFGSYATDLYLPGSDIDMVIISNSGEYDSRSKLYQLSSHLRNTKMAIRMEVIAKTKVPIIKFVDPKSQINIDISFEKRNGIDAARTIRKWLEEQPGLRELVLIIKQFLASRKLNNVHVGGLGGYSTICLVYSFLKMHPRLLVNSIDPLENLGALLIEFFELYGRNFGYDYLAICVDDSGCKYLLKTDYPDLQGRSPFSLAIQDPSDPANNISRGSFNLRDIKKSFGGAFDLLSNRCYDLNSASYKERLGSSILGDVIKYRGKERDFKDERHLIANEAINPYESDGNNDKYYYSDMTVESDVEIVQEVKNVEPRPALGEETESVEEYDPEEYYPEVPSKPTRTTNTEELMGLKNVDDSDDSLVELSNTDLERRSISKEARRDYWLQKGNTY